MIFSRLSYCSYIKYLLTATVFICGLNAETSLVFSETNARSISPPFSSGSGYLSGGRPFGIKVKNEKGEEFFIGDIKGQVTIVVLFTTWCQSCPAVLLDMDCLVEKFKNDKIDNVKIIALNIGGDSVWAIKNYYKERGIRQLDVYNSVPSNVFTLSGIRGVPACLVFDTEGNPVWGNLGAENYLSGEFVDYIKGLAGSRQVKS
jgi:thiol-disulfide isomerase/thioredoxin